ncbi:MAG: sulfatase-like hydrolase/transferase [Planctomycetes bacterium]|nr:sulfatase-like hydrolase/transferase [Planctomycetota bacterium]
MRIMKQLLALLIVLVAAGAVDAAKKPNILIVFGDMWRAQATGYAGDPNVKTPQLDKLAARSADLFNAVSSQPVCCPFRASLITGQRPLTHGVFLNDVPLQTNATTLAPALIAAGYTTGYIGKWHLDGNHRESYIPKERQHGFEYWKVLDCTHDYNHSPYFEGDDPTKQFWEGYDAFAQTADAQKYIRDHAKGDKPFALVLSWGPPHNPYQTAPKEYRDMYDPASLKLRENVPAEHEKQSRIDLAGYYAHCTALDHCIGELMDTLRETGIERDTIVVFTSDHGAMLGSQGMIRKQKPWDESIRTPMLWHYPAGLGEDGKRIDTPMNSEDIMPTLLGLAGVPIPDTVEGLDYSGYMKGGDNPNKDNAALITCPAPFGEWTRARGGKEFRGVRTERYTYARDLNGPWLLYDNQTDPYQLRNLIDDPAANDLKTKLDALLTRRLAETHDDFKPAQVYIDRWHWKVQADGTAGYTK